MGPRESDQGEAGKNEPVGRESSSAGVTADPVAQPSLWALLSVRRLKLSPATNHALERFGLYHNRSDHRLVRCGATPEPLPNSTWRS